MEEQGVTLEKGEEPAIYSPELTLLWVRHYLLRPDMCQPLYQLEGVCCHLPGHPWKHQV